MKKIEFKQSDKGDVAYLKFLSTKKTKKVKRNVRLVSVMPYKGEVDVYIDLDEDDNLIGIEIILDD